MTAVADRDFPFYNGLPRRPPAAHWAAALLGCALAFMVLTLAPRTWPGPAGLFLGMAGFGAANLLALFLLAGADWTAPFARPSYRDILLGLAGTVLTILASGLAGWGVLTWTEGELAANPAVQSLSARRGVDLFGFLAGTLPQLLGEEVLMLVPFLAILTLAHKLGASRRVAIAAAWIGSALVFAAAHLPTYQWHVGQTFATIGVARLALTVPYLLTKNLWSSTIAHVANDWGLMAVAAGVAALD